MTLYEQKFQYLAKQNPDIFGFIVEYGMDGFWFGPAGDLHEGWVSPKLKRVLGSQDFCFHEILDSEAIDFLQSDLIHQKSTCSDPHKRDIHLKHHAGFLIAAKLYAISVADDETKYLLLAFDKEKADEQQFRNVFQNASDAMFIADRDTGILLDLNVAAEELMKMPRDEIIGRHQSELHHTDRKSRSNEIFENARKVLEKREKTDPYRHVVLCSDGEEVPVEIIATKIMYDGKHCLMGTFRNISARIEAENKAREREERFLHIAETNQSVIWESDADGLFLYVSPAVEKVWGYKPEELVGKKYITDLHPEEGREEFLKEAFEVINNRKTFRGLINKLVKGDGSIAIMSTNGAPFFDSNGTFLGFRGSDYDVTQRIKAEEKLKESHQILSKLARQVPGVVYQYRLYPGGRQCFPYSSPAMVDIYGFEPEEVQEDADPVFMRIHPEDRDRVQQEIYESAENLSVFICEFRVTLPGRGEQWRLSNARPERLDDGSTLWHGIITDITERKKNEERLNILSQAVEQSPASILITNLDGNIEYVNKKFLSITGNSRDEVIGQNPKILKSGRQPLEFYQNLWATIQSGNVWRGEIQNRRKNDELFWESAIISPIKKPDGEITHYLGVKEDITRQKIQQEELEKSEERLSLIIKGSNDAPWDWNLETGEVYLSPQWWEQIGYREDEVDDLSDFLEEIIHPDDREKQAEAMKGSSSTKEESYKVEMRMRHKNGHYVPVLTRGFIKKNDKGEPVRVTGSNMDLTERKEAERRLRESEARYRSIIAISNTGAWEYDIDTERLWCSAEYFTMLGYDPKTFDTKNSSGHTLWLDLVHPEDRDQAEKKFVEYLSGDMKKPYENYFRMVHKNGSSVWVWSRARNLKNTNGTSSNTVLGAHIDITESRRAEDEIRAAMSRMKILQDALDNVPVAVYMKDRESRYLYANKTALDQFGYDLNDIIGKKDDDFFDGETCQMLRSIDKKVFKGNYSRQEIETQDKKGNKQIFLEVKTPVYGNNGSDEITGLLGISTDITDRKEAENRIKQSEEYLRSLLKTIPDMLFVFSHDGYYLDYNADQDLLFKKPDQFMNKHISEIMPPDVLPLQLEAMKKAIEKNEVVEFTYQLDYDNKAKYFSARVVSFGEDRVLAMVTDVTESVENLRRIESLLHTEEEHNQRLGSFTHIVSHNLRNHTANIQGILYLLKLEEPEMFESEYIQMLKGSSDNLNETISHLNQVLDITLNDNEIWEKVNLHRVVDHAMESVSLLARSAEVEILNKIPESTEIETIPGYIDSVVLNMITNAIRFSSDKRDSWMKISVKKGKESLQLRFEDNGVGIDLKRHGQNLFGMYKTFHSHRDSKGLGLFITKNQVESMGGSITVESKVDKGTIFTIRLPYEKNKESLSY